MILPTCQEEELVQSEEQDNAEIIAGEERGKEKEEGEMEGGRERNLTLSRRPKSAMSEWTSQFQVHEFPVFIYLV